MDQYGRADQRQRNAINTDGHTLVSACPGAGKTRVLSLRATRLLSEHEGRMVAVTFTRDAANSLRKRILDEAGHEHAGRVAAGTFHSLALSQLKKKHGKNGFRILSGHEQAMLIRQAWQTACNMDGFGFDGPNEAQEAIEQIKASTDSAPDPKIDPAGAVFLRYQNLLERSGVHDFSDLMLRAVREMRDGTLPPMPAEWLLVDEAQDMDDVQYAWIAAHAKAGTEVMCVADDDQSIYQWRQALGYEGLMRFENDHQAGHVTLPINYRCRPEVLDPAAMLISHNANRVIKDIRSAREPGGRVAVLANASRNDEVARLANQIINDGGGEWAVLGRTNRHLNFVEVALTGFGIPYKRIGGPTFWDKPMAGAYIGLLKAALHDDGVGLLHAAEWAGVFNDDDVEPGNKEGADAFLKRMGQSTTGDSASIGQRTAKKMRGLLADWRDALARDRISLVAWGAARWLGSSMDDGDKRAKVFDCCAEAVCRLEGSMGQRLALLTTKSNNKEDDADVVKLMTTHAAKGLEFSRVWIIACEEGVFPHGQSTAEEERRLFYVAMTRAEEQLIMSFSRDENEPSRFIDEAGVGHLTANTLDTNATETTRNG